MMRVRCILVETTVPVKIRPRIETRPVKGHFLSVGIESQFSEFSKYAPRRNVRSKVLVSLLVTGVLWDEVEVFSADDEGSVHLGGDNSSGQDTSTD